MRANFKEQIRTITRWMIRRDMADVVRIEAASFDGPWSEDDFLRCLRQRNCIGMVAEHGEQVVGFMIYELHKPKLHVLNMAVDPGHRRRGVGSQMVATLTGKLSSHRRDHADLFVRESNLPAQLFFARRGFEAVQVVRGLYDECGEDGYRMEYRLAGGRLSGVRGGL